MWFARPECQTLRVERTPPPSGPFHERWLPTTSPKPTVPAHDRPHPICAESIAWRGVRHPNTRPPPDLRTGRPPLGPLPYEATGELSPTSRSVTGAGGVRREQAGRTRSQAGDDLRPPRMFPLPLPRYDGSGGKATGRGSIPPRYNTHHPTPTTRMHTEMAVVIWSRSRRTATDPLEAGAFCAPSSGPASLHSPWQRRG